uniref:Uncharacterized protein n=1 Tax=Sipha flava TaxID=143950 RepID=A0A2S2R529_9HEMI
MEIRLEALAAARSLHTRTDTAVTSHVVAGCRKNNGRNQTNLRHRSHGTRDRRTDINKRARTRAAGPQYPIDKCDARTRAHQYISPVCPSSATITDPKAVRVTKTRRK